MSKKVLLLMCCVFVISLCASAKASTLIDDWRFNFSWEYDPNGSTELCHTGTMEDSLAWRDNNIDWSGIDVNCGHEAPDCDSCRDWFVTPDGNVIAFTNGGSAIFQLLDPAIDANVIIQAGRKYTLLVDLLAVTDDWFFDVSFYHATEPYWIPQDDVNEIAKESFLLYSIINPVSGRNDWVYNCKLSFVAEPGAPYIGDRLGIHLKNPYMGGTWLFADNVRLQWEWATNAYNPSPADGEQDVLQDKNLTWTPGLWVDQHIIYFGTDWEDVNERSRTGGANNGALDVNSFNPPTLELGKTYYWTVTEVNENYIPIPGVPNPPWLGDIWSFTVEGRASNPIPPDGAQDVAVYPVLKWLPGTGSDTHNVYFGMDEAAVENATTASIEYMGNFDVNSYDPGPLELDAEYYWRIDEVNDAQARVIKGYVWNFTTSPFVVIDDFESYDLNVNPIYDTWTDFWVNDSTAEIYLQIGDVNYIRGEEGQSMEYRFENSDDPYYAETSREFNPAQDWTVGGTKILTLYFRADFYNDQSAVQPMSVFVSDGVSTATVEYADPNDLIKGLEGWQQWNIDLQELADAGVDLTNITEMGIVIGDGNEAGDGYVYFDDIRLYPPENIAYDPSPADGEYMVPLDVVLTWKPGRYSVSHDVYFGTDYQSLSDADRLSPEYRGNQYANTYDAGTLESLEIARNYYWRIDEVSGTEVWTGNVWSFTTLALTRLVPAEYETIQAAIDDSVSGDVILVADGIYTGDGNRDIDFLGKTIALRSENGPQNCIIDCQASESEQHWGVYIHHGGENPAVLDGFTIKNGSAAGVGCYEASPIIKNCIITENTAMYVGGGIYSVSASPTIKNCEITDNVAPYGAGIAAVWESNCTIVDCLIARNNANDGPGGGIDSQESYIKILNSTITVNSCSYYSGGGISLRQSNLEMKNCILWDNLPEEIYQSNSSASIKYSDIEGGYTGTGNISLEPLFTEPVLGNYRLLPNSPCIDAGDPYYIPEPDETDLDGNPRITDGRIDMGAYESEYDNLPPIADAGPDQTVYTDDINSAQVTLDGSGSYDPDDDELTYSWSIDGYEIATGVSPTIFLPVGEHAIDLIVSDSQDDSEPDQVVITVSFTPDIKATMELNPPVLNCNGKNSWFRTSLILPEGFLPEDVDTAAPAVTVPGDVESTRMEASLNDQGLTVVQIDFKSASLCEALTPPAHGLLDLTVIGSLTDGRNFYATDKIKIKQ
jgi:hypothetical protein